MFQSVAPQFQDALKKSGYDYILKFDPSESEPKTKNRSKKRAKRHILWYNPPYNATVGTNVGKEFLKLIDECFPPSHPLHPIFNRKNVKVSYSCTPNIEKIIAAKNTKVLKPPEPEKRSCSCTKDKECPLDRKCLNSEIIYQATVKLPDSKTKTYIGLSSTEFKKRLAVHEQTFNDPTVSQTSLSKYIHELQLKNIEPTITWKIMDRGKTFSPVNGICQLCTREAYQIVFHPERAELNARSEIFSACKHKKSKLLFPPERGRKKKKSPGT